MSVVLPYVLTDGTGFAWDIQTDGRIGDGSFDAFDGGLENPDQPISLTAETELSGRQILLQPGTVSGYDSLDVERRIYVPEQFGWARFIDTFTNTGLFAATYAYTLTTNFGSDSLSQIVTTSSGDQTLDTSDLYVVNDDLDPTGSDPAVALVYGDGSLAPTTAAYTSSDIVELTFTLTLQPGETVSLMSFAAQGFDQTSVSTTANMLQGPVSAAMEYGIPQELAATILNYDVSGFFQQSDYFGNELADTLLGSERDEQFFAAAGDDVVFAQAGRDTVYAGDGADVVSAGDGGDRVLGGGGSDVIQGEDGDDVLLGEGDVAQWHNTSVTVTKTDRDLSLSVRAPDASTQAEVDLETYVTRRPVTGDGYNLVFVIDVSGSMLNQQADPVADLNVDGVANQWIDLTIAAIEALRSDLIEGGHAATDLAIISYYGDAQIVFDGAVGGASDVALRALSPGGATNFEVALQRTIAQFSTMGPGQNEVWFLSDGFPTIGGAYLDEALTLRDPIGLDAHIRSIALGASASLFDLDLLDDGLINASYAQASTVADLTNVLTQSPVDPAEIDDVVLSLNGVDQVTLNASDFTETPLGLYAHTSVAGLWPEDDDTLEVTLTASDTAQTSATLALTLEEELSRAGADILLGGEGADVLSGQDGHDRLLGDAGADVLSGGHGYDALFGGVGNDRLFGDTGDDTLHGGPGADLLIGGAGADTVSYSGSISPLTIDLVAQTVSGGDAEGDIISGIQHVEGTAQDDVFLGNDLDNIFRGGLGNDWIYGGVGFDTADYSDVNGAVYVALNAGNGTQSTWAGGDDYLYGIEALVGTQFDDYLIGDAGYNELSGGGGNDVIRSKGGNDRLDGGSGNDKLEGHDGDEVLIGDTGADELYGNAGFDVLYGGSGNDYVAGGRDDDLVYGQGGADILRGNRGNDLLDGGRGWDDLRGGGGDDTLWGGRGDDYLAGENGNDVLNGGRGDDVLLGGDGADIFAFDLIGGFDAVRDFTQGIDLLDLSGLGFTSFNAMLSAAEDRPTGLRVEATDGTVAFVDGMTLMLFSESDVIL